MSLVKCFGRSGTVKCGGVNKLARNCFVFKNIMAIVIASSKPWHRQTFETATIGMAEPWLYVETTDELEDTAVRFSPRFIFFLHWNWKVPSKLWNVYNCVCFHMTDLPYGRGGSPLQNLILNGKSETVISALRMVEEMDAGPIYGKQCLSLEGRAEEIYLRAGKICWKMIHEIIQKNPTPTPQEGAPTYFKRRKAEDSRFPPLGPLRMPITL